MRACCANKKDCKQNFVPLNGYILVEPCELDNTSTGGIVLVASAQDAPSRGYVRAIPLEMLDIKVGDLVTFPEYLGHEVEYNGKKYRLMKYDEIFGRIV